MNVPVIGNMVDERFLTHRLRSTSLGAMAGAVLAGGLFLYAGFMAASTVVDRRRKAKAAQAAADHDHEQSGERGEMDDAFHDLFVAERR